MLKELSDKELNEKVIFFKINACKTWLHRRVRVPSGAGIVNFGVFPAIGARFFINYCGFESVYSQLGPLQLNVTLIIAMLILLGLALFFTFTGGQISVLITDFWQGLFATIVFMVLILFLWKQFSWEQISETMTIVSKPGESLIDPLDISQKKDFSLTFFAIAWFFSIYNRMAWQGTQGYNCAAITAHEAKMSKVLSNIRGAMIVIIFALIPLAALTYLHHPNFSEEAIEVNNTLQRAFGENETLKTQMRIPVALTYILPTGLLGAFAAAMLGFFISTNNTYLHSWGSIFVQDVICPLRKNPLSAKKHLLYLRISIVFVAVFAFFFSVFFSLEEYIRMFFIITGAVFMGGAGAVIIGGLYWKRGTTSGAYAAMIVGSSLAVGTIILRPAWKHIPFIVKRFGEELPFNSQVMSFFAAISAVVAYIVVSLLSKKVTVDMDKLFHRGKYTIEEEDAELVARGAERKAVGRFWKMLGVNDREFSKLDKGLFLYVSLFSCFSLGSFFILLFFGLNGYMTAQRWLAWWRIYLAIMLIISMFVGVWLIIGGLFDLKKMYSKLQKLRRNELDDGRVSGDHLLADEI